MQLYERDIPLQALDLALQQASGGAGCIVLVSGEAGIGKTTLIETFATSRFEQERIWWGTCDALFSPRPLGPLFDIALQSKGELLSLINQNADRSSIFTAFFSQIQSHSSIVIIDDVHWADEATLDLIKFVGRRIQRTPSLLILTYRDDEIGAVHPLRYVLGELPHVNTVRLPLSPLSRASVRELARLADQEDRADDLFSRTNGNPFFVTEVLASKEQLIPSTVRDAVLARAARLSAPARSVLEAAAVIGGHVEPWLVEQVSGAEAEFVEENLTKGTLQVHGDFYAFRHELARQAVLEAISSPNRLALHRRVLNALEETLGKTSGLARLANHAIGSNDQDAVLEYAPAAARQASAASSHREAIALYEFALRFADSLPPASHAKMLEAYEVELWYANRTTERMHALQKAIELWHSIGDRRREGDNVGALSSTYYSIGLKAEAEQACRSAIAILEALPPGPELARAYRSQSFICMENRDFAEAVMWGEKAIALAQQFNDLETVARACNYAGCSLLVMDYERGRALMEQSLHIGREANLPWAIAGTLANLSQTLVELYQFEAAASYFTEGIAFATEHDDDYHLQEILTWQAFARFHQGQWAETNQTLLKVLQRSDRDLLTHTYALLTLGRLHVRMGESSALTTLDEGLALSMKVGVMRLEYARAARAELGWLQGDYERTIEEARAVYDNAVNKGHPWIAGELAFWRWRAGDTFKPPTWIARPFALQIAGDWRGAAQEWESRGCIYEQAMALMDGDAAAQLAALEIFERLGARPAVEKLKAQMRQQGLRGIPRGPRPISRQNRFGLTGRELEVLGCLAEGLDNRAIAQELTLSIRTVEHHIASILHKMQVSSRHEAVRVSLKESLILQE